jgi:hypothetical protein
LAQTSKLNQLNSPCISQLHPTIDLQFLVYDSSDIRFLVYDSSDLRFLLTDFPVINVHVDELSSARIWQHKLCATLSANVNINYRLPIKVYYRICTLKTYQNRVSVI